MTDTPERPTVSDLRSTLLEAGDRLRGLREKSDDERTADWRKDIQNTTAEILAVDAELTSQERSVVPEPPESRGPEAAFEPAERDTRSLGQMFTDSEQYENRTGARTENVEFRTLLSLGDATSPAGPGSFATVGQPIPPSPRQERLFVRDLLSVQATGLANIPYIREKNIITNESSASGVAEGGLKPEAVVEFDDADAPVRKIAAWLPITEEVVADAPTLQGYVNNRLLYLLKIREERQVLAGNDVSPAIKGILNYTGGTYNIQTQSAVASDYAATIGQAAGKIEVVDGFADGVVMHPTDFWVMLTTRHSSALDNGYSTGLPYGTPPQGAWGLPTVRTRAQTAGHALVGNFRQGATLFDRQQSTIRTTDSHSDYFIYNKLVILAEERIALAVFRPDFFVDATL